LAAELRDSFKIDANLIAGSGGIFEVIADGKKVYSKEETGHFPEPGEVTNILKSL